MFNISPSQTVPTFKHGDGSVMVWRWFVAAKPGQFTSKQPFKKYISECG